VIQFVDSDNPYKEWTNNNPNGFVVNSYKEPSSTYLILHKASCYTITELKRNAKSFTDKYSKTCSDNLDELDNWAKNDIGGELCRCRKCFK